ncbi:hypothetical protein PG988_001192 [Apiospora saccharicola]
MESDWQATLAATSPPEKPDPAWGRKVKSIMNNYICPAETLGIKEADGHLALVKLMTGKITTKRNKQGIGYGTSTDASHHARSFLS